MDTWTAGDTIVNGIKIHYHRTGGDRPALVLAHGITDNGLCWTRVACVLQQDYDVIMLDARGHGLSASPAGGYALDDLAADLAGAIEALKVKGTAIIGHSMGAATAALMAVCHPGLVSCLILEDPGWWLADESDERRAQLAAFRDMLMERRKVQSPADLAAFGRQMTPSWAEEEFGPWAEAKFQFHPNVFDQAQCQTGDWREIVPKIKVPTLLITADVKLGAIITTEISEQVRRLNSNIQTVHIPESGHNIRRDQFERYIQAVQQFLDKNYIANRLIL